MSKTIMVEFLHSPTGAFGMAYNKGEKAAIEELVAGELIDAGFAKVAVDGLPADLPNRKKIEAAGIKSIDELKSIGDLTSIEGINEAQAAKIKEYLIK